MATFSEISRSTFIIYEVYRMKCAVFVLFFMMGLVGYSKDKDSTRWDYRLKGIDFHIGTSYMNSDNRQGIQLVKAFTPAEETSRCNYDEAVIGDQGYYPVCVRVSAAFSNDHDHYEWFFSKKELVFGIGFESEQVNQRRFKNILNAQYPMADGVGGLLEYTYQCQYMTMGYQWASRPFRRYFALFGGIHGHFGLNTYKQIDMEDYYTYFNSRTEENYNVGYFSSGVQLGLKYNFSCDLNFFAGYASGLNAYGREIGGWAKFSSVEFGMRYKVIDDQDRPKYELMKYW